MKKHNPTSRSGSPPTLISLFAGAGGLDLGLEQAGFRTVVVNELELHACTTLDQNRVLGSLEGPADFDRWFAEQVSQRCYKNVQEREVLRLKTRLKAAAGKASYLRHAAILQGDIRSIPTGKMLAAGHVEAGQVDLVAGGPPCQPFSRAGKRETVEADDGRLFLEFVRVVNEARPRWFLFENVKGLAQSKTTVVRLRCNSCTSISLPPFEERRRLLSGNASGGHCPKCQSTSVVIQAEHVRGGSLEIILAEFERVGYRCVWKILDAADFGVPQSRERLFIVGSRDGEEFLWPQPQFAKAQSPSKEDASRQMALLADGHTALPTWRTVKDVLWQRGHPVFGHLDYDRAVLWVKNVVRPHAEPVTWVLDRPSPTVGAHQAAKLALAPLGVPEEQLRRQQWHVLGRRQGDTPPVKVEHEYLSDDELLLLQTFPDDWYVFGTRMERAFQIGNAVPPLFARAIGESLIQAIRGKSTSPKKSSSAS